MGINRKEAIELWAAGAGMLSALSMLPRPDLNSIRGTESVDRKPKDNLDIAILRHQKITQDILSFIKDIPPVEQWQLIKSGKGFPWPHGIKTYFGQIALKCQQLAGSTFGQEQVAKVRLGSVPIYPFLYDYMVRDEPSIIMASGYYVSKERGKYKGIPWGIYVNFGTDGYGFNHNWDETLAHEMGHDVFKQGDKRIEWFKGVFKDDTLGGDTDIDHIPINVLAYNYSVNKGWRYKRRSEFQGFVTKKANPESFHPSVYSFEEYVARIDHDFYKNYLQVAQIWSTENLNFNTNMGVREDLAEEVSPGFKSVAQWWYANGAEARKRLIQKTIR